MGARSKINAISLNVKINKRKSVYICGYKLPINVHNFIQKGLAQANISTKVVGGYFFDSSHLRLSLYKVSKHRNSIFCEFSHFTDVLSRSKNIRMQPADGLSSVSIDRYSTECTSARHKTGNYNGIPVFVKFVETESLTLSRNDLFEVELVRKVKFV